MEDTQSPTIGKLALALSKAQSELNGAAKGSENPFFKSKYADLYQCIEASKEALSKNELAVIQTTRDGEKGITIITTLAHSSGEWIRGELTMKPKKDDDQSRGSSITYGRRYTYAAIVGLAQKDDDANGSTHPPAAEKPQGKTQPEQPPQDNREKVEKALAWIDGHIEASTSASLEAGWNQHFVPRLSEFTPAHQSDLNIAYKDTMKLLIEQENKA